MKTNAFTPNFSDLFNMTVDELYNKHELTARNYNICKYNGLTNLGLIINFYVQNRSFRSIRACGRYSNEELIQLCKKYSPDSNTQAKDYKITEEKAIKHFFSALSPKRDQIIENIISMKINRLSYRSRNVLSRFIKGDIYLTNILASKVFSNLQQFLICVYRKFHFACTHNFPVQ